MAAQWPTAVATDANLYVAVNELQNNLASGINSAVTTLTLNSTTSFPTVGLVLIDNEVIKYTGVSGATLTGLTRGYDGTTAAAHSSSAVVSFAICADHHNVIRAEVEAIEQYLSDNLGTGATPLGASTALATDSSKKIVSSTTTDTELGYVHGVTSAIQTQLNTLTTSDNLKAPLASPTFTGTITTPLTVSKAVATGASSQLVASTTTAAELGFVSGVTSAIQTQLTGKAATDLSNVASVSANVPMNSKKITGLANGTASTDAAAFGQIFTGFQAPVVATTSTDTTSTSDTFIASALTASITLTNSAHRVLVYAVATVRHNAVNGTICVATFRDTTNLDNATVGQGTITSATAGASTIATLLCVDSPGDTSAHAYTVYFKNHVASGTAHCVDNTTSRIMLIEIV